MLNESLDRLKRDSNNIYIELYKNYFSNIKSYILKNSGTIQDAEDNFQDTLIVIIEKMKDENFHLTSISYKQEFMA
jgi:DNA-directed RNA polymerase specialized sigma24 family protein